MSQSAVRQQARVGLARRVAWARLPWAAAAAAAAVAVANAIVYAAEWAAGVISPQVTLPSMLGVGPVTLVSVVVTSIVVTFGAAIVFAVIALLSQRPVPVFWVVSAVVAALSLAMPATVPGPAVGMRLGLALMHVIAWAVGAAVLTRLAGQPGRGVWDRPEA